MKKCESLVLALVVAGLLPLTGCVILSNDVSYGEKGPRVSDEALQQIESGRTTRDWVIATLGAPSEQETTKEGLEILKYRYTRREESTVLVLPFLIVDGDQRQERTVYFEVKDGVVQRYWKDDHKI